MLRKSAFAGVATVAPVGSAREASLACEIASAGTGAVNAAGAIAPIRYAADAAAITPMTAMRANAITRRCLGGGEGSGAVSATAGNVALSCDVAWSDAPHLWHCAMSRLFTAEHAEHSASCKSAAHSLQYFAAAGLSWPQNEQCTLAIAIGPSAVSNSTIEHAHP